MAEKHDHGPSSSGNVGEKLPFWEKTKDRAKELVVKWMAGVAIVGTALGVTGCGRGDRIAVPESPSVSASESPSTSPSATEKTVDPKIQERMQASEKYEQRVKEIDATPYDEFLKLSSEERDKALQAEIELAESYGWTKDKTDSVFYPKDSDVSFGAYYKEPASPTDDARKVVAQTLLPTRIALAANFDGVVKNSKDYALKVAGTRFVNPEMREYVVHEQGMKGKITTEESRAKIFVNKLLDKRFGQISSGNYQVVDLPKISDIAECESSDPNVRKIHFFIDDESGSSTRSGIYMEVVFVDGVWKIKGFPTDGIVISK